MAKIESQRNFLKIIFLLILFFHTPLYAKPNNSPLLLLDIKEVFSNEKLDLIFTFNKDVNFHIEKDKLKQGLLHFYFLSDDEITLGDQLLRKKNNFALNKVENIKIDKCNQCQNFLGNGVTNILLFSMEFEGNIFIQNSQKKLKNNLTELFVNLSTKSTVANTAIYSSSSSSPSSGNDFDNDEISNLTLNHYANSKINEDNNSLDYKLENLVKSIYGKDGFSNIDLTDNDILKNEILRKTASQNQNIVNAKVTIDNIDENKNPISVQEQYSYQKDQNSTQVYVNEIRNINQTISTTILEKKNKKLSSDQSQQKKFTIVIDPGHGGKDPGAIGVNGTLEKEVTLRAAKILRNYLAKNPNFEIYLTRNDDVFLDLNDRQPIAIEKNADLFISIHADASENSDLRGASVYTLSKKRSQNYDKNINNGDYLGYDTFHVDKSDVSEILVDLARSETENQSEIFAMLLAQNISKKTITLNKAVREAGYVVLLAPTVPAILLEMAFISNVYDEKNLNSKIWMEKLMFDVAKSINYYYINVKQN